MPTTLYVVNFYEKFYLYGNCKNKQKQPPRDVLKKRRSENMQHNLQESTHGEVWFQESCKATLLKSHFGMEVLM